jgi:transcriptional regulator with XRE-family HTH domain
VNSPRVQEVLEYFSSNVRRLRLERKMTQEVLAEAIDIELRSLQRIEAATANPSITVLINLADVLGVKPGALFEETERPVIKRGRPKKIRTP